MAGISDEKLQELRDRVDLVAVVSRRVQLKKSGIGQWKGLCPFHGEKTPSFYVTPQKNLYKCFGCGKSGDSIRFVMEMEGRSFREAVEQLANEAGVVLEADDPAERQRTAQRAAIAEVNEKACTFFERVLWEHPLGAVAREHLAKRGITVETAKAWRLGYAPDRWDSLNKSLAKSKVDPKLIEQAGLGVPRTKGRGQGTLYDRFRGRLTIPIRESGRTVAFGGRLLEGQSEAKYLNSPETPLYQKGHTLFALDKAREAIRKEGHALFVEGYFDAIGLHQAGVQAAVATCGTSLTERHLDLVRRAGASELVFIFDGDAAGIRAATRASEIAAAAGVPARVLVPPDGEDPDETVLRIGTEAFRGLVASAQPALEFLLDRALLAAGAGSSIEARVKTVESVAGIVRAAPSPLAKDLYIEKVAERLGAPKDAVRLAIEHAAEVKGRQAPPERGEARTPPARPEERPGSQRPGRPAGPQRGAPPEPPQRGAQADPAARGNRPQEPQGGPPPSGSPVAAQPPRRSGAGPIEPHRLEGRLELQIVAQMLVSPALCALVDESGVASTFRVAALREFSEVAFAAAREGRLEARAAVATAESEALRKALEAQLDELDKARAAAREGEGEAADRASLLKKIERHKRSDFGIRHRRDARAEVVGKPAPAQASTPGSVERPKSDQKTGA